jgi:archaeal flagellar protein FlaI
MALTVLPFTYEIGKQRNDWNTLCAQLSPEFQEACANSPFLTAYLIQLPIDEIGLPTYYAKPTRNLGNLEVKNLIYPIKEGLFVHLYPDFSGARDHYISIEPTVVVDVDKLMPEIDDKLVAWAEDIGRIEDKEEKKAFLLKLVDNICTTRRQPANGKKPTQIVVSPEELEAVRYRVLRDKVGLGILQPLLLDNNIEDISCSGVGHIFIEHKIFKSVESSITFVDHDDVDNFAVWLGEWIKSPVTVRNPLVDAILPDGSRINIVYGREISKRGSNFTIRKFSGTPTSVLELVEFGSLDYTIASYLSLMMESGMNCFVVGATASGKTTLLNAITTFIKPDSKIVTIEDTPEVQVPHANWVQESTRSSGGGEKKGSDVGMFDLLKAALRQRPDMIIVGEIRSVEAVVAFQAMQTGHGVMSTFHAATVEKLIQRLTGDPINIPKTYIDNLNLAVIQSAVRLADGKAARRVMSVNEIIGYDPITESFSFLEAFRWNPTTDKFEFPGYMNSYLLEQVIAIKRGIPPHRRKEIYTEVKRRAKIFEKLHKEKGITDFHELFQVLAEARRQKLL